MRGRRTGGLVAIAVAAMALVGGMPQALAAGTPTVKSVFNANDEGWRVAGDTTTVTPTFKSTGGNPGGYVEAEDAVTGGVMYWQAPAKFLGNRAAYYEGTLKFDLKQSATDTQFEDDDVELIGGGLTLTLNTTPNPGTAWTRYTVKLVQTAGWRNGSVAATEANMRTVLQNLTAIRIRAEFRTGADTDGLDNVSLTPGPQFSVGNVSVTETDTGTVLMNFVVKLAPGSTKAQTVSFTTADGTAAAGKDYTARSGTLTFNPGVASQKVAITVLSDNLTEPNETLKFQLSGGSVPISKPLGTGTIVNDD